MQSKDQSTCEESEKQNDLHDEASHTGTLTSQTLQLTTQLHCTL